MSLSAADWAAELDGFGAQIEVEVGKFKRDRAIEILRGVVEGNPFGDPASWQRPPARDYVPGYSAGSWQITSDENGEAEEVGIRSKQEAIAVGIAAAQEIDFRSKVWIVNPAPYIGRLEGGYSPQKPDGWIDAVLARVEAQAASGS